MAIEDGVFLNQLDIDRVFRTIAAIESERLNMQIIYTGKRLKESSRESLEQSEIKSESVRA